MNCCEKTIAIPLGIFVPIRDSGTTTHSDATAQTLFTVTLPEDDLTENLMITLLGEHTSSTVRVAFQIPLMVTRRTDDSPQYSVNLGSQSYMTDEDSDIEVEVEVDGSNGVKLNIVDQSGDAGIIDWTYQIWTLDQLKHTTESAGLLLDTYTGSMAAYSLRKLSSSATNVIRVRRSSDNAEQDFTADEITDGTLTTFTGANDGFVTTWYDQSGNGNNITQSNASAQPKIVSSGVVITESGQPAMELSGGDYFDAGLDLTSVLWTEACAYAVYSHGGVLGNSAIWDYEGAFISQQLHPRGVDDYFYISFFNTTRPGLFDNTFPIPDRFLLWCENLNGSLAAYANNIIAGSATVTFSAPVSITRIGSGKAASGMGGNLQEHIIWGSDQSANRLGIQSNVNSHYSIY